MKLPYYSEVEWGLEKPRDGDAGYDIRSAIDVELAPREVKVIPTGIYVALPPGTVGLFWERSSIGPLGIARRAGAIDRIYRGELKVALQNLSDTPFFIRRGDKIVQMIIVNYCDPPPERKESKEALGETERGEGGFGSTGLT